MYLEKSVIYGRINGDDFESVGLKCITLHCIALHFITLHFIPLHSLHCITLHIICNIYSICIILLYL